MSEVAEGNRDWASSPLIEMADYFNGAAFKPKDWGLDGLPIIRIEQMNKPESDTDKYSGPLSPSNVINTGDLIFSWSATLKVLIWKHGPGALNQHLYKVVPKHGVEKLLLLHLLDFNMEKLAAQSQGSTMRHVTRKELSRFKVAFPKQIPIQQKIARILQTVDRAMEKTEAMIEKYQQIKAGLLHDLFTRGLWTQEELDRGDHQGTPAATAKPGQLRPIRQDAPHLYQQTPIGWIPKAWEAIPIKKLYKNPIRDFGSFSSTNLITFLQEGVPFIKSEMIKEEEVDWSNVSFVSKAVHRLLSKSHVNDGQILFSKIGSALGKAVLYCGERGECNSNAAVAKIELNESLVRPQLVEIFLNSKFARKQFEVMIISLLPRINLGDIDKLIVPVPQVHEQDIICERYQSLKLRLRGEIAFLAKLRKQKFGLMHDLLTGKVPVTPDPEEASAS